MFKEQLSQSVQIYNFTTLHHRRIASSNSTCSASIFLCFTDGKRNCNSSSSSSYSVCADSEHELVTKTALDRALTLEFDASALVEDGDLRHLIRELARHIRTLTHHTHCRLVIEASKTCYLRLVRQSLDSRAEREFWKIVALGDAPLNMLA